MNIASIDIGTNTVLLLIAEIDTSRKELKPLYNRYEIPRIGKGVASSGYISEEKIEVLTRILTDYANEARKYNCNEIIVSGTYPFRAAKNGNAVIEMIEKSIAVRITSLSGEKEANLSFIGAISDISFSGNVCVIDIGGGSTELIFGNNSEILAKKSAPIGVVNQTEELVKSQPVSLSELDEIRGIIQNKIKSYYPLHIPTNKVIAIAGTPTTLACMKLGLPNFDEEKIHKECLSRNEIEQFVESFAVLDNFSIKEKYSAIVQGREDVILMGSILLVEAMDFLRANEVVVSSRGLRYGAIIYKYF